MPKGSHHATLEEKMAWLKANRDIWAKEWRTKYSGKVSNASARQTLELMRDAGLYSKTTFWQDAIHGVEVLMKCVLSGTEPKPSGYKRRR